MLCSPYRRIIGAAALLLALSSSGLALEQGVVAAPQPLEFLVTFDSKVSATPFTGRVFVMLSKRPINGVLGGINWFNPEPTFALDIKDWQPGQQAVLAANAMGYPYQLAKLPSGKYWLQAVMDFDRGGKNFSAFDGNGYSKAVSLDLDSATSGPISLTIDQVYASSPFRESVRVKLVDIESKLLSEFNGRPTHLRAAVLLPKSYAAEQNKRYPIVYEIPGFGGTHAMAAFALTRGATDVAGVETLHVVLDPSCRWGHSVFADSDNNGPCGKALIEELIPHIEKQFRALGRPSARFVAGHSSGGWSSLWLQVTYPDFFGGVWSTAPDPIDFRDFLRTNLYQPGANLFVDEAGKQRPLARSHGKTLFLCKPFSDMEVVMGHGGQLVSFEAVFGPRGPDGKPAQLWNRQTGAIDIAIAKTWERYDIRMLLENNWQTLGPKLAGKVHVYVGSEDMFFLEGPVRFLKESLGKLGSDAVIEIFPGKDHGTLMDAAMRQRIAREMAEQFRRLNP
ncbi:MAG TPA: alpha/beta hydrolase [Gemmataceae bacterium]|nr:alpha/beta hydrolase [Gemmataceae bacterium]